MRDLGALPGQNFSTAEGINNAGQVVGHSDALGVMHPFLWQSGVMTDLGTLTGGRFTDAFHINDVGQVVGYGDDLAFVTHALLWQTSGMTAAASATPSATDAGLAISFTCSAAGGTEPYTFSWTFGDGGTAPTRTASHAYSSAGIKTATCSVTDALGNQTTSPTTVQIHPPPTVAATVNRTATSPGLPLAFSASVAGGVGGYTYDWTFGDGGSANAASAVHTYARAGHMAPR